MFGCTARRTLRPMSLCRFNSTWFDGPIWTSARAQEVLNRHKQVADCVVADMTYQEGIGGRLGLVVPVASPQIWLPFLTSGVKAEVNEEDLQQWLKEHGYAGPSVDIRFLTSDELDDADVGDHGRRVVMRQLIRSIFDKIDADGDGHISFEEFQAFLRRHDIDEDSIIDHFHKQDTDQDYSLDYQQFKSVVRESKLLVAKGVDGHFTSFHVADQLYHLIAKEIFLHADEADLGYLELEDVVRVFELYYIGNAKQAAQAFAAYDVDKDGRIGPKEFGDLLAHEGVVSTSD